MKKLVIQLFVGMFLLCCGFQAIAQTSSFDILTLSEKLDNAPQTERERFITLKIETAKRAYVESDFTFSSLSSEEGPVEVIEFEGNSALKVNLNENITEILSLVEMIILNVESDENFDELHAIVRKSPLVRYIVIRSYNAFTKEGVSSLFEDLSPDFKNEVIIEILPEPK